MSFQISLQGKKRKGAEVSASDVKLLCKDGANPASSDADLPPLNDSPISHIPEELLVKIFHYGMLLEGTLPFYKRIVTVCQQWHRLSLDRQLWWTNVDLSYRWVEKTPAVWQQLCENKFSHLEQLTVRGWRTPDLQLLLKASPGLARLDISRCHLSPGSYQALTQFKHLRALKMVSMIHKDYNEENQFTANVLKVLESVGEGLQEFNVSGNPVSDSEVAKILDHIALHCRSLMVLDLCVDMRIVTSGSNSTIVIIPLAIRVPVKELQENCPGLRVLRLPGYMLACKPYEDGTQFPGFRKLEEFTIGRLVESGEAGWIFEIKLMPSKDLLLKILQESCDLKILHLKDLSMADMQKLISPMNFHKLQCSVVQETHT